MITIRLQGHAAAPLFRAVSQDEEGNVELLVFADVKSGITVEVEMNEDDRREMLAALEKRPIIQTASAMPPARHAPGAV